MVYKRLASREIFNLLSFKSLFLKIVLLFPLTGISFSQQYNFRSFSAENGLSQPYVYSVIQDSLGNLWIGTDKALFKYNGLSFESFNPKDSVSDNFITTSLRYGSNLWFGHMNGTITCFDGREFSSFKLPGRSLSRITHLSTGSDGRLWLSTFSDGIFEVNREKHILQNSRFSLKDQLINCFHFISADKILVGTASGLKIFSTGDSSSVSLPGIPDDKITAIEERKNHEEYFIATENQGIFVLSAKGSDFIAEKLILSANTDLSGIQSLCIGSRSELWLATFGSGLLKLKPSADGRYETEKYSAVNGMASDNIKTVFEDREGCIWAGTFGNGLAQAVPVYSKVFTFDQSTGNRVFSICSSENYKWIGTDRGLIKMDPFSGKVISFYGNGKELPADTVTSVWFQNDGQLWVGTNSGGAFVLNTLTNKTVRVNLGEGRLENSVTSITGKDNIVWIGTKKGLCRFDVNTGLKKWYSISQGGMPHNYINGLYQCSDGRLYVSTRANVLTCITDEKTEKIPLNLSGQVASIGPVAADENSRIWVGSGGSGILVSGADSVIRITANEGLLSDYCYSLIYNRGYIWAGHKGGLSIINTSDFSVRVLRHIDNTSEPFGFNPNAAIAGTDNMLWFGTDKGLLRCEDVMHTGIFAAPLLSIASVTINDELSEITGNMIKLRPGNYRIRIGYIGSSLMEPDQVTYTSMLKGYDGTWSDVSGSTSVMYPRLAEGKYTFMLKAFSGEGVETAQPLIMNIIIAKPLWKRWWFFPAAAVLSVSIFFIIIRHRERKFRKEKKMLEEKVKERTHEIRQQKSEIEKQRDLIEARNASITSSITYARHIQTALLPPVESIDELLPESFIMSKPKDIVSGDFYWITEKNNKIVFTVADCTGHGVPGAFMSLLGITLLNEIVNIHGITRSDIIVSELRKRVIRSLQQNRKDITTYDGMDIALCVLDNRSRRIQFTGGMNDLVFIHDGKIDIIKADHLDVSASYNEFGNFRMTEFCYNKGDMIYLFSDGYQDQFGGEYNKKFLRPHFYTTLYEVHKMPVLNQKEVLEKKLETWMKSHTQTDDITIMGIRL